MNDEERFIFPQAMGRRSREYLALGNDEVGTVVGARIAGRLLLLLRQNQVVRPDTSENRPVGGERRARKAQDGNRRGGECGP
jgi:hypothetical protein